MSMISIEHAEEPINIDGFSYVNDYDYPYCMLGFQIKNFYDQKRLRISNKFISKDIIHFVPNETVLPKFFRGMRINIKPKYAPLIKQIDSLGINRNTVSVEYYKNILNEYNLKCDNCFAYLCKGVYPIDSEYLNIISDSKININNLYNEVLDTNSLGFQSYGYFVIYILSNKNTLNTTTKNFIDIAVKTYKNL